MNQRLFQFKVISIYCYLELFIYKFLKGGAKMGGCCCPSNDSPFSPILFFATSNETDIPVTFGTPVDVITLGVSPANPGSHQVKLDSTVELVITQQTGVNTISYDIRYRLQKNGANLAELRVARTEITPTNSDRIHTEVPNLTWNDIINASATYTVEIQVMGTAGVISVVAQTKALNAIVF